MVYLPCQAETETAQPVAYYTGVGLLAPLHLSHVSHETDNSQRESVISGAIIDTFPATHRAIVLLTMVKINRFW